VLFVVAIAVICYALVVVNVVNVVVVVDVVAEVFVAGTTGYGCALVACCCCLCCCVVVLLFCEMTCAEATQKSYPPLLF
jgi:hypothetical protein